jgi:hypothetical protein
MLRVVLCQKFYPREKSGMLQTTQPSGDEVNGERMVDQKRGMLYGIRRSISRFKSILE